jgi:hypothetical protein
MTTNHPEQLDAALVRFGRIDMSIRLDYCSHEQIRSLFDLYYHEVRPEIIEDAVNLLTNFPAFTFSPAEVSSTLQHYRERPDISAKVLCDTVRPFKNETTILRLRSYFFLMLS